MTTEDHSLDYHFLVPEVPEYSSESSLQLSKSLCGAFMASVCSLATPRSLKTHSNAITNLCKREVSSLT